MGLFTKRGAERATGKKQAPNAVERSWLARHLDGWQAGVLTLLLAGSSVALAVPRAVEPSEIPSPMLDATALRAGMAHDDELAKQAETQVLDVDVRAVGTEVRLYNVLAAEHRDQDVALARRRLLEATARALHGREAELLALRAYQMREFIVELRAWQRSGIESAALRELGGDFLPAMQRNGWCDGPERTLRLDERVLRVLYKKRWNDITGADAGVFALGREEERLRFGFFLRHPWVERGSSGMQGPLDEQRWRTARDRARLSSIDKLAQVDPSYPAELARGVVLYRLQLYAPAAQAFRRHLERAADGPYTLYAQNYLKAALDRAAEGLY